MMNLNTRTTTLCLSSAVLMGLTSLTACQPSPKDETPAATIEPETQVDDKGVWFYVLVKSANYAQSVDGSLKFLNNHFFAEIFPHEEGIVTGGTIIGPNGPEKPMSIIPKNNGFYYEGGHYQSVPLVDADHPNGQYDFNVNFADGSHVSSTMTLADTDGNTDIPDPIRITYSQNETVIAPNAVDPAFDLNVSWSKYSNGTDDKNGIVDDMIFVVFQDCHGDRVFHTGLPFKEPAYLKHDAPGVTVPKGSFRPGETYAMFVEFPHVTDSTLNGGVPGFVSYATATYLDAVTLGEPLESAKACPEIAKPLDTGQTDRMEDTEIQTE